MILRLNEIPMSLRTLFTGTLLVLGIGYLFAMIHLFNSHAGRDGKPGMSVDDLIIAYSGSKEDSKLEAALKGPMAGMLPTNEKNVISAWVRGGAGEKAYGSQVAPLIEKRCLACHDGSNPHIADLTTYQRVLEIAALDTGTDIFTLIRVSHIHVFGITFIFFIMGLMFSHATLRPVWLKSAVIAVPFVAIILDVGSWYLTKVYTPFAWVVMIGGGLMGVCFTLMWWVTFYQMWFYGLISRVRQHQTASL